jgi:hypothetical protein
MDAAEAKDRKRFTQALSNLENAMQIINNNFE